MSEQSEEDETVSEMQEIGAEPPVEGKVKKAKAPKAPKAPKVPKEKKRGVGTIVREAILAGKTLDECVAAVLAEIPNAKTTAQSVQWYRNDMKTKGQEVPVLERRKPAKKAEAEVDPLA